MRHPEGPRFDRRLKARRAKSEREQLLEKFGPRADERNTTGDRRQMAMTPDEVDDWLKRNGITGGDRRKGDRRRR